MNDFGVDVCYEKYNLSTENAQSTKLLVNYKILFNLFWFWWKIYSHFNEEIFISFLF